MDREVTDGDGFEKMGDKCEIFDCHNFVTRNLDGCGVY